MSIEPCVFIVEDDYAVRDGLALVIETAGLELQDELVRRNSQLPIIFLTAHGDMLMKGRAIKAGAADFLMKPVPSELLIERIQAVL
jgi:FixJ family two-component response regulator